MLQVQISIGALPGRAIRAGKSRDGLQQQTRAQAIALGTRKELEETKDIERGFPQGGKAR